MTLALVVEDNEDLAANVAELLETAGVETHIARDTAQAEIEAARHDFDLAIIDLRLPNNKSGVDLIPFLQSLCPYIECILVTGNATVDSAVAAVRHGAAAYVQKPFDSRDLLALAERVLSQVKLRRERERLAVELSRSEALHRGVVETVETLIVTLDGAHRITMCNRFALQLGGWQTDDVVGRAFADLYVGVEHRDATAAVLGAVDKGTTVRDLELPLRARDGSRRTVRWTFAPLETRDESVAALAVGIDETKMRDLQRRTVESEAMAAVGSLTTGLAHEIRNPLNAASLQLEALVRKARKIADTETRDAMESRVRIVRGELSRLTSMLDEFLSLARPRGLETEPTDLVSLVDEVVEFQRPLAEEQGVILQHTISRGAERVMADRAKIKQVLVNLIANALEAMRDQGGTRIDVRAEPLGENRVVVTVRDDGPGPPKDGDDLFQAFVTTKEAGTGLGLAIVKKIVTMHGGEAALLAAEDRGAVARFTLRTP